MVLRIGSFLRYSGWVMWWMVLIACKKEVQYEEVPFAQEGMLVLNEGNFMLGNSSLSFIQDSGEVYEDVFRQKNGFGLGDVGQSLYYHQGYLYLVVNNSNKIYRLNTDFEVQGEIGSLTSPRYFLPVNDSIALVTDLYENGVSIVNYKTLRKVGVISIPGWTEEIVWYQDKVWVSNPYSGSLYIVDGQSLKVEDSLRLQDSFGSTDLEVDAFGNLWVLCWGNASMGIKPSLVQIRNRSIQKTFAFSSSGSPSRLTISKDRQTLYWIESKGVYKMPVQKSELSVEPFIQSQDRNFYNLYVHPEQNELWIADAKDYVQKGEVLRYSPSGELLQTFKVGIIPSFMMYFKK